MPEAVVQVGFDEDRVWCKWPDRAEESLLWSELIGVAIETTDEGPFSADVFWILGAKDSTIVFPGGATGEQELLRRLQELPNFNNEAVISAAACADNNVFLCWQKDPEPPR